MKIVAVSDEEIRFRPDARETCDLLVNCGDLSPHYLENVLDRFSPRFSLMVHGNHDNRYFISSDHTCSGYGEVYKGLFILRKKVIALKKHLGKNLYVAGFSGSRSYGDFPFHFEENMARKFRKKLERRSLIGMLPRIDIMLSHTPPHLDNVFAEVDNFHAPSVELRGILDRFFPPLWFYGHLHPNYYKIPLNFKIIRNNRICYLINTVPVRQVEIDENTMELKSISPKTDWVEIHL